MTELPFLQMSNAGTYRVISFEPPFCRPTPHPFLTYVLDGARCVAKEGSSTKAEAQATHAALVLRYAESAKEQEKQQLGLILSLIVDGTLIVDPDRSSLSIAPSLLSVWKSHHQVLAAR